MKIFGIVIAKEIYMPILIIVASFLLEKLLKIIIKNILNSSVKHTKMPKKKADTLKSILLNITRYVIWIVAALMLLSVFGVNISAIIAGLGVMSLIIGLAFQDILKDILVGVSILFENQFSVGDLVKIGDFTGTVRSIGLKTTRIKAYTGEVKIISNRNISEIINYSLDNTYAIVDIPVSYESKIEKVEKILMVTAATLKDKIPDIVGDIELLGVQELSDSAVVFRLSAKCLPAKHFGVQRILKKEFKNSLDKNGIKIPYMQIEVHNDK